MKLLTSVLKDPQIRNYISEQEDSAFEYLKSNFSVNDIYEHITNNIQFYIEEDDLESSYENIKNVASSYTIRILNEASLSTSTGNGVASFLGFVVDQAKEVGAKGADAIGTVVGDIVRSSSEHYKDYSLALDLNVGIHKFNSLDTKTQLQGIGEIISAPFKAAARETLEIGSAIGVGFAKKDLYSDSTEVIAKSLSKAVPSTNINADVIRQVSESHSSSVDAIAKAILSNNPLDDSRIIEIFSTPSIKQCVAEISNQPIPPKGTDYFQNVDDSFSRAIPGLKVSSLSSSELSYYDKFFDMLTNLKNNVCSNISAMWDFISEAFRNNSPYAYGGLVLLLASISYILYKSITKFFNFKKK